MSFKNVHLSLTEGHELNWLVVQLQLVDVFVHLYMRMSKKSDCECVRASERETDTHLSNAGQDISSLSSDPSLLPAVTRVEV